MPKATSRAQFRFMHAVAGGRAKSKPKGLSRAEAAEYVRGQATAGLPEYATPRGRPKRLTGRARRVRG